MLLHVLLAMALVSAEATPQAGQNLPSQFTADLVYLKPELVGGKSVLFYTDTGGGYYLSGDAVRTQTIDVASGAIDLQREMGTDATVARLMQKEGRGIPEGLRLGGWFPVVLGTAHHDLPGQRAFDGVLGAPWFAGRVWTWDFKRSQFRIESSAWKPSAGVRKVGLGFRQSPDGKREMDYPRIDVRVDGQQLPMLLDTGANTVLSPEALNALNDGGSAQRSTSMIVDSVFQTWRKAHPDWKVIEQAQSGTGDAMIEVPDVEIAGWRVGPVWFTHRADHDFHDYMSTYTDIRVEGAIGNNVYREFRMTLDYPNAAAYFSCTGKCRDAAK